MHGCNVGRIFTLIFRTRATKREEDLYAVNHFHRCHSAEIRNGYLGVRLGRGGPSNTSPIYCTNICRYRKKLSPLCKNEERVRFVFVACPSLASCVQLARFRTRRQNCRGRDVMPRLCFLFSPHLFALLLWESENMAKIAFPLM